MSIKLRQPVLIPIGSGLGLALPQLFRFCMQQCQHVLISETLKLNAQRATTRTIVLFQVSYVMFVFSL